MSKTYKDYVKSNPSPYFESEEEYEAWLSQERLPRDMPVPVHWGAPPEHKDTLAAYRYYYPQKVRR